MHASHIHGMTKKKKKKKRKKEEALTKISIHSLKIQILQFYLRRN